MKQFTLGLLTIVVLVLVGYAGFRGASSLMSRLFPPSSPTPTPAGFLTSDNTPSPTPVTSGKPNATPIASVKPTTKGGEPVATPRSGSVQGASTSTTSVTTTHTISHVNLTLVKSSSCPASFISEIKDVQGALTLKRSLHDGGSIGVTVWNKKGEEVLQNTAYSGSGDIKRFEGLDYLKVRVETKDCPSDRSDWLVVTAER